MKKLTFILMALVAGFGVMNAATIDEQAAQLKASVANRAAAIHETLPSGYQQLGDSKIYYSIANHYSVITGTNPTIDILGEIDGKYYSSTYNDAGYLPAFSVNGGDAEYLDCVDGNTIDGVHATASIVQAGDVAARIVFTLTNTNNQMVTVDAGVYGDVMIGSNDNAPISKLAKEDGTVYGLKMKYSTAEGAPLLCALFGEGVTGVDPADTYWFGSFAYNYYAYEVIGAYRTATNWMVENGNYDSGMGWCWKNRTIEPGESIELSFLISVGEIEFEEPIVPGEDVFTYNVEAYDIDAWNDLTVAHPAHIWGYYEHPYGQNGYIEYQVDATRGWTRIADPLISGEEYDLPFDMMFDPDLATVHTLQLRFTDGMDNYTDLEGLSWRDVRSLEVAGLDDRVYSGHTEFYNVTVDGVPEALISKDVPGTYTYTVHGHYVLNTIGVNEVEYTLDKGMPQVTVVVPEDVEFDNNAHGATVTVVAGGEATVTYVNAATGEILTEAPVQTGVYVVIVEVAENDYYYGMEPTIYGQFEIYTTETAVNELTVAGEDNGAWYTIDGRRVSAPTERGLYIHNGKKYIVK